jgi:hypothetical protein
MELELILLYLVLSLVAGIAGRNRRIGFWGFLFASIIFTPFVSLMFMYFSTPIRPRAVQAGGSAASRGHES